MAAILASKVLKVTAPPQGQVYDSGNSNNGDGSTTNVYVQGGRQRRLKTSDALIAHGVKYFQGRSASKSPNRQSNSSGVASYGPEGGRNGDGYRSNEPYAPQQGYYERQQPGYPSQSSYGPPPQQYAPPQHYSSSDRYYAPPQGPPPHQKYYGSRDGHGYERPPTYSTPPPDFRDSKASKQ